MPEDRTHVEPSGLGSRFSRHHLFCRRNSFLRAIVFIWEFFGVLILHASENTLPLLKNFPAITKLSRRMLWAIRTQSTWMSGAMSFHCLTVSLWTAPSCETMRGTMTAIATFFSLVSFKAQSRVLSSFSMNTLFLWAVDVTFNNRKWRQNEFGP